MRKMNLPFQWLPDLAACHASWPGHLSGPNRRCYHQEEGSLYLLYVSTKLRTSRRTLNYCFLDCCHRSHCQWSRFSDCCLVINKLNMFHNKLSYTLHITVWYVATHIIPHKDGEKTTVEQSSQCELTVLTASSFRLKYEI